MTIGTIYINKDGDIFNDVNSYIKLPDEILNKIWQNWNQQCLLKIFSTESSIPQEIWFHIVTFVHDLTIVSSITAETIKRFNKNLKK